jgi:hypothetical protein
MARFGVSANLAELLARPRVLLVGQYRKFIHYEIKEICLINHKFSKEVCLVGYDRTSFTLEWFPTKHPAYALVKGKNSITYRYGFCYVKIKPSRIEIDGLTHESYLAEINLDQLKTRRPAEKFYAKYYEQIKRTPVDELPYLIFRIDREYQKEVTN